MAFLFSISIIVTVAFGRGRAEALFAQSGACMAEICPMRAAEAISVVNMPVDVEAQLTALYGGQFGGSHRASAARVVVSHPVGRDDASRDRLVLDKRPHEGKAIGQGPFFQSDPTNANDVMGGSQAQVSDVNFNLDSLGNRWVTDKCHFFLGVEKYVGSQLPSGSILSPDNQLPGSSPKKYGGEAKDGREGSYNDSAEGDPKLVMSFENADEPTRAGNARLIVGLGFLFIPAAAVVVGGLSSSRLVFWLCVGVLTCWFVSVSIVLMDALGWLL
ncbi:MULTISPECIES: hypothetical protein [unclassified Mesorhizobium]|uniref:hypothetical protein n=1 Tax=unclassified Mesorhizobium TaxID=325217 RepID=UPI001127E941|nr:MULTISPECIES: hypothetical protein [unclassified Mesorhizobium]TPN49990.1 hypothetical protein FJ978_17885 [Mesorhizobium sp. B1-1-7]TPN51804.1 hypothetical protein FJ976_14275 [Mesorhizobium sp. B1-1-9]